MRRSPLELTGAPAGTLELFQSLRDGTPRTRSDLAAISGQSRATIAARVDALMELGLIAPLEESSYTGGRPSSRFALAPLARLVVAVDVGASHLSVGIADLSGTVLVHHDQAVAVSEGPEVILGIVSTLISRGLADLGRDPGDLVGVGIGIPGPVQQPQGITVNPPIMPGWDGFDIPRWIAEHLGLPAQVDNDVNIMALGEQAHAWPEIADLLYVKVATGVGSGIITGGNLQRGAQGMAGDIGHIRVPRGSDALCRCGNTGCLEALASGPALIATLAQHGVIAANNAAIIDLARAGNPHAIAALRQAGRDIGEVLSAAVSLINPSVVVLGGSLAQAEHLIVGVREVIYRRAMPAASEHLQVASSGAGARAALYGAATLAVRHALSPQQLLPATPQRADSVQEPARGVHL